MRLLVMIVVALMLAVIGAANTSARERVAVNTSWASWYGPGFYNHTMGCGGRLTTKTWGVANKSLRCGTSLTICYHHCVVVRVVDRGPYVAGRDFDLTYPVKVAIGMPSVGKVRWWINK